jgi:hypothetical protein
VPTASVFDLTPRIQKQEQPKAVPAKFPKAGGLKAKRRACAKAQARQRKMGEGERK